MLPEIAHLKAQKRVTPFQRIMPNRHGIVIGHCLQNKDTWLADMLMGQNLIIGTRARIVIVALGSLP
jgi:hypothetical protein